MNNILFKDGKEFDYKTVNTTGDKNCRVKVFNNDAELSLHAALEIIFTVLQKPSSVFCLAAGETPTKAYQFICRIYDEHKLDFSQAYFVSLDEWIGIPSSNQGSCQYFLRTNLLNGLNIQPEHVHLFNGMAGDLHEEVDKMDSFISAAGGIDCMLVGIGMNGHIGFNEPGISEDLYTHVIQLDNTTQEIGQKYFNEPTTLNQGITVGLRHFMEARKVLMLATGKRKQEIIKEIISADVSNRIPATVIRKHNNGFLLIDREAAGGLQL